MAGKLVAYFSASSGGVTRKAAERIAREEGADLYEIRPAEPYTEDDLYWPNFKCRSIVEMMDRTSRPALADKDCRVADYDEIWIGFPIWCETAPHVVLTFLESYDFTGKTMHPFATSGGSGYGRSNEDLRASAPGAEWLPGKMVR